MARCQDPPSAALTGLRPACSPESHPPDPSPARRLLTRAAPARSPKPRRLLTRADTRFLLADCRPGPDLARRLGALVSSVRRFGCARVYLLRG